MKIKLTCNHTLLTLFVLLHLVHLGLSNLSTSTLSLSSVSSRSKSIIHKEKNHLKDHSLHSPNFRHHKMHKSTNEGYFEKTSKKNQSTAAKALSAFVLGIILYICSIHFICWNERRAVKDTEFVDFIRQEKKSIFVENAKKIEVKTEEENKVFIVNGVANVTREATIENFPLNITSSRGKICVIKTKFEKFSKTVEVKEEEMGEDQEGNTLVRAEEKTMRHWSKAEYTGNKFASAVYYGEVLLGENYSFPMENLSDEVERNQTPVLADNTCIYLPKETDIELLEEFFKSENVSSEANKAFKILTRDQYVYILRSNTDSFDAASFNPETYEFSDADLRMSIRFFYVSNANENAPSNQEKNPVFTVAGKLSKEIEKGVRNISSFKTNLRKAGCSYFCCCCADDESFYEVNLLYTKRMTRDDIVNDLELQNTACTCFSRIGGFLMHFAAVYLILYPLILLIGMIPFLGAIGATILIFFAFILALMTFLFVIACAWICARPVYAVLIFGFIFILMFVGKSSRDQMKMHEENESRGGYMPNNNGYKGNYENMNNRPKRKFL